MLLNNKCAYIYHFIADDFEIVFQSEYSEWWALAKVLTINHLMNKTVSFQLELPRYFRYFIKIDFALNNFETGLR